MTNLAEFATFLILMTFVPSVTGDGESGDTIVVNALGRSYTLGMLYDRRSDRIIPGKTLWNHNQLQMNISRRDFQSSRYEVQIRDSIEAKTSFMNIEGGIKASFLCGLVSIEGSAKYLNDYRSSKYDARVAVKYDAETHFEMLTMSHLNRSNIMFPEVLDDEEATHVVVGIEYGVQAYFIFEKRIDQSTDENEVYGELEAVINAIPLLEISVHGRVEIEEELRKKVNDLSIKFHGDFVLPHNPTTFEEAVKLYKELPNYVIGENAHSVPMRVYLYPLKKIDPLKTFGIVRDISESLIAEVVTITQELEDAKEDAQDLAGTVAARYFGFFGQKVSRFLNLLRQYKQEFQSNIGPLLVQIRGNGRDESELARYLERHFDSPFSKSNLDLWINQHVEESSILQSFVQLLQSVTFCKNQGEYIKQVMTNEKVVSLNMYFPETNDPVLDNLDNFLDETEGEEVGFRQLWFHQFTTLHNLQIGIEDLLYYQETNKNSPIVFIYAVLLPQDPTQQWPSAEIKSFHSEGRQRHEKVIIPPGQPLQLTETTEDDSITIQWQQPQYGSDFIDHYQIEVSERGHRLGQDLINYIYRTTARETQFQISTPQKSLPFDVTVHGVCRVGRTASSEILHHSGIEVRLVGGAETCSPRRAYSGRVEVLKDYIWGTVCGPWTDKEAAVACRMMGFTNGVAGYSSTNAQGSGQIWMSNARCNGSEENLDLCSFDWATDGACNHTMDAVIDCYGGQPTGNATTPEECTINTLQELLTLARSDLDLAREELTAERDARVQEMAALTGTVSRNTNSLSSLRGNVNSVTSNTNRLSTKLSKYLSVAFHTTVRDSKPAIAYGDIVKFKDVKLNIGNGYRSSTGVFTVPSRRAGLYYFYVHLLIDHGEYAWFRLEKNGELLCTIVGDNNHSGANDRPTGTCAATVRLSAGDRVYVQRDGATNNTPLHGYAYSGFTGFLMKPED